VTRAHAFANDENGYVLEAAAGYEAALQADPTDLEATLNLVVLYWQVADGGAVASASLPEGFPRHAARRLAELLEGASRRFTDSAALQFWKKYICACRVGLHLEVSECRRLLREDPSYREPAFVVFCDSVGTEAEPEAMRLLAEYSEQPTARGRYVTSVISGTLRKQRFCSQLNRMDQLAAWQHSQLQ
jgi:hypothetical protein